MILELISPVAQFVPLPSELRYVYTNSRQSFVESTNIRISSMRCLVLSHQIRGIRIGTVTQ